MRFQNPSLAKKASPGDSMSGRIVIPLKVHFVMAFFFSEAKVDVDGTTISQSITEPTDMEQTNMTIKNQVTIEM